jgi:hypothetical protein
MARPRKRAADWERLERVWYDLPEQTRFGILAVAGVVKAPEREQWEAQRKRTRRGETPVWLPVALTLLHDAKGRIADRVVARQVGVAPSTLSRNETYRMARYEYYLDGPASGRPYKE